MPLPIEVEREDDGRWLAEVTELPGVLAYGAIIADAVAREQMLALRVLADRVEHGEAVPTCLIGWLGGRVAHDYGDVNS